MSEDIDDRPTSWLLLNLLWEVLKLVAPIALVAWLPLGIGAGAIVILVLAMLIAARFPNKKPASSMSWLATAALIGFSIALAIHAGSGWSMALALLVLVLGLAGLGTLDRHLGIGPAKVEPQRLTGSADDPRGESAWRGGDLLTPEGERIRTFAWSEIAMGGPTLGCYLFPDGVLLDSLGASVLFSACGRYFAAPLPSRSSWGLLILDRKRKRVHLHADIELFWELDRFDDEMLIGRHSPLIGNHVYGAKLSDLLELGREVDLVAVNDLWVMPEMLGEAPAERVFPASYDSRCVTGVRYLPECLRAFDDPAYLLRRPVYRLSVDGQLSELLIDADEQGLWSPDGRQFICFARPLVEAEGWSRHAWAWEEDVGWQQLAPL
ncbi:hypothetical protein [Pseudomonas sp. LRF_L74]|uniref:hypothetical protein n=1 Tax=Pseudomonas sp. LRF_L74 TaxID=3369422 RepID=UPI003F616BC9